MLSVLLARSGRDCKDFVSTYDNLMAYLAQPDSLQLMEVELAAKNVPSINFYDVVMDYLLIDSFEVSTILLIGIQKSKQPPCTALCIHRIWNRLHPASSLSCTTDGFPMALRSLHSAQPSGVF